MSISVSISGQGEIDAQIDANYQKQLRRANRAPLVRLKVQASRAITAGACGNPSR